jgi:hypothetical protein
VCTNARTTDSSTFCVFGTRNNSQLKKRTDPLQRTRITRPQTHYDVLESRGHRPTTTYSHHEATDPLRRTRITRPQTLLLQCLWFSLFPPFYNVVISEKRRGIKMLLLFNTLQESFGQSEFLISTQISFQLGKSSFLESTTQENIYWTELNAFRCLTSHGMKQLEQWQIQEPAPIKCQQRNKCKLWASHFPTVRLFQTGGAVATIWRFSCVRILDTAVSNKIRNIIIFIVA